MDYQIKNSNSNNFIIKKNKEDIWYEIKDIKCKSVIKRLIIQMGFENFLNKFSIGNK